MNLDPETVPDAEAEASQVEPTHSVDPAAGFTTVPNAPMSKAFIGRSNLFALLALLACLYAGKDVRNLQQETAMRIVLPSNHHHDHHLGEELTSRVRVGVRLASGRWVF